jgi:hypothetical protein
LAQVPLGPKRPQNATLFGGGGQPPLSKSGKLKDIYANIIKTPFVALSGMSLLVPYPSDSAQVTLGNKQTIQIKGSGIVFQWPYTTRTSTVDNIEVEGVINDSNIDVVQAPFNILDNASKREVTYIKVKKSGKILHARSVFLQGLIFKNSNNLKGEFSSLKPPLEYIEKLCKMYKLSINELALSYVLSKTYIDGVLIGIDNVNQLINNMEIAYYKIPDNLYNEIDNLVVQDINILNPKNWLKNT